MAIHFRDVHYAPLRGIDIMAPDGAVIGIVGERGCGATELMRLAAGLDRPTSGEIEAVGTRRYLGMADALNFAPVNLLLLDHAFAGADALVRARGLVGLDRLRAGGTTVLMASHEPTLLRLIADEVWWLEDGQIAARGDAEEVLRAYEKRIAAKFRAWGEGLVTPITPALRKGDGRAEIVSLETVGSAGKATAVLQSGEDAIVRVVVRFAEAVANPVIGVMIRTRLGLEVYGTNTEVERVDVGSCASGDMLRVEFRFRCDLCPKEYTLTAASHDPDGTAHDWIDDAVSFTVADERHTAGVVNLRARVTVERDTH